MRGILRGSVFFWLTVFACWAFSVAQAEKKSPSEKRMDPSALEKLRVAQELPLLAGAIARSSGTQVFVSGVRKWGDPTPSLESDKHHLGSCTKAMTATLLAIQIEKGALSWDSTLAKLFPEFAPSMNESFKTVTLSQLTAHRSGLTEDIIGFQGGAL
jgi:CubicO group peptidase (beta-lactamase class C family)